MTLYAEVVFSLPVSQSFTYSIPESLSPKALVGSRVLVPFGQRVMTGFIVRLRKRRQSTDIKLKDIVEVLGEEPVFSSSFLSFTRKLSDYFYSSWGEVLQASLPPSFILRSQVRVSLTEKGKEAVRNEDVPPEEQELLSFLGDKEYTLLYMKRKLRIKNLSALLSRLEKRELVHTLRDIKRTDHKKAPSVSRSEAQLEMDFSLDSPSRKVAEEMAAVLGKQAFSPFLLHGPSEKREGVYFYLIKRILEQGKKVLFLVPEIALTQSLREQFEKKLGEKVALLHSRLTERMRELEWLRIKKGKAPVVVGPRSALFAPVDDLGLIVVDEEQDESYFQPENPSYDARRGAWLRAKQEKAGLVYGSAFPTVSAFYRARRDGYLMELEHARGEKKRVEIVDDRRDKGLISQRLAERIAAKLRAKESTLVFLNRRGYASYILCSNCRRVPRCVRCDIALAYHKREKKLICHYCDFQAPAEVNCPDCGSRMIRGRGVGIEAVEEELRRMFPKSGIAALATDLSSEEQDKILQGFRSGKIDILVGTQLLAHQAELPQASLVSILYPETLLTLSDYKASQKTFHAISQMMRFLRKKEGAEIIIQTGLPHHFSIRQAACEDYMSFFDQELNFRSLMKYPPFIHLVEILFQGESLRSVARQSREFLSRLKDSSRDVEILGPALAPISRLRGQSRVQVILKSKTKKGLDDVLGKLLQSIKVRKSIHVFDS